MRLAEIALYRAELPLAVPYRLSYRTFESFEPVLVRIRDDDGREGWGEQHISPGSSAETREGGWAWLEALAPRLLGRHARDAAAEIAAAWRQSPVAATALWTALEMLGRPTVLESAAGFRWPLLAAVNADTAAAIPEEVERRLDEGYRTFKVKVGKDVMADLARLRLIQAAVAGRATLRIDANRAFSRDRALAFVAGLDPAGVELFEQPCASDDWAANATVAAASPVPLMLDEPICGEADIDRAAGIAGVGLCKLKLKRFGSLGRLEAALGRVAGHGMKAVLGDGLGAELNCWMEACVARRTLDNTGEFNGYLKLRPEARLLAEPLGFADGQLVVPAGYWPEVDLDRLNAHCLQEARFARTAVSAAGSRAAE
jgi:L-alanine-DL-glutamate epimerase-like enolase superfamily enzyme